MDKLKSQLTAAGISHADLELLAQTDRGDVWVMTSPGGEPALALWRKLRALSPESGHWPVLLGDAEKTGERREIIDAQRNAVAETLQFSQSIAMPDWFDRRAKEQRDEFLQYNPGENPDDFLAAPGDWPSTPQPHHSFLTPFDLLTKKPLKRVAVALVPTTAPWEVPAFLAVGGWNDCPEPAVHCAAHRYWQQEYGAVVLAATNDVVEMEAARPPKTREAALALARQQYHYCTDIVEQGTQTLSNLASSLLNGPAWFFWWD